MERGDEKGQKRWREADTALKGREEENKDDKRLWSSGRQKKRSAGKRCREVRRLLFSDPPALRHGGIQTTAQLLTLTQTFFLFFIFTSVKWNSEDESLVMLFLLQ